MSSQAPFKEKGSGITATADTALNECHEQGITDGLERFAEEASGNPSVEPRSTAGESPAIGQQLPLARTKAPMINEQASICLSRYPHLLLIMVQQYHAETWLPPLQLIPVKALPEYEPQSLRSIQLL